MSISRERALALMPTELTSQLQPGEVPLSYEPAQQFAQADAVGKGAPTLGTAVSWDSLGLVIGEPLQVSQEYVGSKVSGLGAGGAQGSLGDLFNRALSTTSVNHLLLTSHRFAVTGGISNGALSLSSTETILFAVDRRAVLRIARAPRLLQRARVKFDFADGSWAMAMMGMFLTGAANRLISAFEQRPG
ncbi:hypothetical protein EK0264_01065 [Epidermidibacterium keratini]|uniref:Uncharacterized protein n=1 Tax=Epidermidibacterium keratini TaxID=1891644 RepID=A0A7L4YKG2_9ACTN|nr:hypothetical protein [Epidermidibacterium keratini]QHB99026.1 hypothetical protein EK0264_01065 [Epidermidibacterium keratini]